MEFIKANDIITLSNLGVDSEQLLFSENSISERVTITKVTVQPNAVQSRHAHLSSEQIWVALEGHALLLLANNETKSFDVGDVVRFADGDVHGLENKSADIFVYLSVTSPPINFRNAYKSEKP